MRPLHNVHVMNTCRRGGVCPHDSVSELLGGFV
jgi:hypothetical protein